MPDNILEVFGEIIHAYSRGQALADGNLVELPAEVAANAGLAVPVALTRSVWEGCVSWSDEDAERTGAAQDEDGRLWDVVWMARQAIRTARHSTRVEFVVHRVPCNVTREELVSDGYEPPAVQLVVAIGPGDNMEPVITIHEPSED